MTALYGGHIEVVRLNADESPVETVQSLACPVSSDTGQTDGTTPTGSLVPGGRADADSVNPGIEAGLSVTAPLRDCAWCHTSFAGRSDARTCSATCRKRLQRGTPAPYVITAEDRAAMDRAAELVPIPVPPLTPAQIAWAIAAARVNR